MKKISRLCTAIIALSAVLVLAACSSAPTHTADASWDMREMHGLSTAPRGVASPATSTPPPTSEPAMAWAEEEAAGRSRAYAGSAHNEVQERAPRRIKIGRMTMEAEDVVATVARFESYTEAFGGWVQSRNMHTWRHPSADLTLRIPAALYDEFVLIVSEFGRVVRFDDSIIDVSAEYFDSQARLNINRAEEARLLEFIENSTSLEDIIMLESRLSEVRTDIELHENNIRRINRDVMYSTLHVNLYERDAPVIRPVAANLTTRMGDGFTGSITSVTSILANIIVFMVYVSVPLVLCGACAFVGIYFNRRRKRSTV